MFASKRQSTLIDKGFKIVGTLTTEGSVEIRGEIDGEMRCGSVVVSHNAHVTGSIFADTVVVNGKIDGPIDGGEVVLKSQAHVSGDIRCQSLVVEKGAFMEGRLLRDQQPDDGRRSNGGLDDHSNAEDMDKSVNRYGAEKSAGGLRLETPKN